MDLEIKVVKEFKNLIAKDRNRDKREAVKWFAYIYYMNDYRSPYFKVTKSKRHEMVCSQLDIALPFKIFPELQAAIDKFLEFQETPSVRSLKSIMEGLVASGNVIDMITKRVQDKLEELSGGEVEYDPEEVDVLVKDVDRLLNLSDKLPKAVNTIKALEEEVKKEQASDIKLRGGGEKGAFEE